MLRQVEDIARGGPDADSCAGGSTSKAEGRRRLTALLTHRQAGSVPAVAAVVARLVSVMCYAAETRAGVGCTGPRP
jgi:hypothetical protein